MVQKKITETSSKLPDVIDNRTILLKNVVKDLLKKSENAKIATGYFFLSGFDLVKDDVQRVKKIQIIMGRETDIPTKKELVKGYEERRLKEQIINGMIEDIKKVSENEEQIKKIKDLHDLIREGKIEVKIYTKEKFHSKAYIFELRDSVTDVGIIGSSNFTASGLTFNTELNSVHTQRAALELLNEWFEERWEEAEDFREDLIKIIEESEAYRKFVKEISHYVYVSPLDFFKMIIKIFSKQYLLEKDNILLPFQELDYKLAKDIINKFGGVIIANSVGLGKSYIASRLLQDYHKEKKRILLIIPPNLREQWEGYLKVFNVKVSKRDILSMYEVSQKDFPEEKYHNYDVILVDESHNFRNDNSNRWKNFMKKIKNNKAIYILLTATPINNSLNDLKTQIDMFKDENKFRNEELFRFYNSLKKYIKKEDERLKDDIKQLRRKLIVRTTRRDLKRLYKEIVIPGKGKAKLKEPILKPQFYTLKGDIYEQIFDKIVNFLSSLELPHLKILNPDAGKYLVGLYKILLYKRLESSIYAFYRSIIHLENKEKSFENLLKKLPLNKIREMEREELNKTLRKPDEAQQFLFDYVETEEKFKEKESKKLYLKDIKNDLKKISEFKRLVEKLKLNHNKFTDDKIIILKRLIEKHKDKKILLFTQFIDTADYLYENFKDISNNRFLIRKVTGDTKDKIAEVIKFSPSSQEKFIERSKEVKPPFTKFLISTDALSEGVNLQEADYVINYDLPWNPVRLIQRIGRAHRIGSNKDIFVVNFIPDKNIDKEMKLVKTLKTKINNIIEIIGAEYSILTIEELEKIRKKEVEDMKLLAEKRQYMRKLKLDKLEQEEERSKLSGFDRYLINIIETHGITKKDLAKVNIPNKVIYTILNNNIKGNLFIYSIDDGETVQTKHIFQERDGKFKEEFIPKVVSFISYRKQLTDNEILQVDNFKHNKLKEIEFERKKQQHIVFDERTENLRRKIVRELQNYVYNKRLIGKDEDFKNNLKERISSLEKRNIPEVYYKEIHEFYLNWIKNKQFLKAKSKFLQELDSILSILEKASKEIIQIKDIKAELKGFIVYGR